MDIYLKKIRTPPYSPDINVIEMVWANLKRYIREKCPKSLHELIKCIRKFENKCNSEYYKRYADHTKKVLEIIIKRNGEWSDM